jgi:hypothetical protein
LNGRLALALFGLALLTRLPFATQNLYAPDSVLYARGIERFDPMDQRPQPPGYLWYVLLLRGIDTLLHDANRDMTVVSAIAGALTIVLVYALAARLYDERTGRIAAVLTFTAVTFWAYGGVAYPYTLLAALTTVCALLFWRAYEREAGRPVRGRRLLIASAAWGLAIGFRSDLAIFLAPLWLLAAAGTSVLAAAIGALVVATLVIGWVLASAAIDGGPSRFLDAVAAQSRFVDERYSVFGNGPIAIYRNTYELGRFLGRGLYLLIPLVGAPFLSADARRTELRDRRRVAFLLVWTLAPLPFYVFVHVGEYGYVFSMLPGLAIVAARGAIAIAKGLRRPRLLPWLVAGIAVANGAIFLLSDTPISAQDIARHDRGIDEKVAYLRETTTPSNTLVVTAYDAVLVDHYLGHDFPVLAYDPGARPSFTERLPCPNTTQACGLSPLTVVLWDDLLRAEGPGWGERRMPHGGRLRVAVVPWGASLAVREGLGVSVAP